MRDMLEGCCVCSGEYSWPDNPLNFCDADGCTVAIHQDCYEKIFVTKRPWYCRKCTRSETKRKVVCYICQILGKTHRGDAGACMQYIKSDAVYNYLKTRRGHLLLPHKYFRIDGSHGVSLSVSSLMKKA